MPSEFDNTDSILPASSTVAEIETAQEELIKEESVLPRLVEVIRSDGVAQVAVQFPKSFLGKLKGPAMEALYRKYPVLEPIVETFVDKFVKFGEDKIKASQERVAQRLLKDPTNARQILDSESSEIVADIDRNWPDNAIERVRAAMGKVQSRLSQLVKLGQELQTVREKETEIVAENRSSIIEDLLRSTSPPKGSIGPQVPLIDPASGKEDLVTCQCSRPGSIPYVTKRSQCKGSC